jgi:hypothetical protein
MEERSFGVIIEGSFSGAGMFSSEDSWGEVVDEGAAFGLGGDFGMTSDVDLFIDEKVLVWESGIVDWYIGRRN